MDEVLEKPGGPLRQNIVATSAVLSIPSFVAAGEEVEYGFPRGGERGYTKGHFEYR